MLVAVRRLEPMLLEPVADRRFVKIEALTDLRKRKPPPQHLFQRRTIHALDDRTNICSCVCLLCRVCNFYAPRRFPPVRSAVSGHSGAPSPHTTPPPVCSSPPP